MRTIPASMAAKKKAKKTGKKAAAKPKLLSGGNPQIPKADGDPPVQAFIAAMPGWKRDVGRHLDVVVEAVFEDEGVKRDVFARLEEVCRPEAILATNTSSFSVTWLGTKWTK